MSIEQDIIKEARTWVGTSYGHLGRVKGKVVDCIGLPVGVAKNLKMREEAFFIDMIKNHSNYSRLPTGLSFYHALKSFLPEYPPHRAIPSDVVLLRAWNNDPSHVAILTDVDTIIHSNLEDKECVEHQYSGYWKERTIAAFRLGAL